MPERSDIKELLIDPFWAREADAIIDTALARGLSYEAIAAVLVSFNTDILILWTANLSMKEPYA